ncbi:MAG: metal-sulfur cluster assembly factor [Planctomycetes bacterium]|nr:metal-sulfur cluster assembly factor [Planctomycetota bacterium]
MPAVRATRAHDVKVADGGVWVQLRDAAATPATSGSVPAGSEPPRSSPSEAITAPPPATGDAVAAAGPLCEDTVRSVLKEVKDPELFVNIVDLGLIYGVTIGPAAGDAAKHDISVDMTMTSPACPAGPQLIADTKRALTRRPDVASVEVRIVMDPPWTPDRMTEAARDQLGIF